MNKQDYTALYQDGFDYAYIAHDNADENHGCVAQFTVFWFDVGSILMKEVRMVNKFKCKSK